MARVYSQKPDAQAETILESFNGKGYNLKDLKKTKEIKRDRDNLFKKKENKRRDYGMAFITGFTRQHTV